MLYALYYMHVSTHLQESGPVLLAEHRHPIEILQVAWSTDLHRRWLALGSCIPLTISVTYALERQSWSIPGYPRHAVLDR